jgi:oxygen-dependent protoporphyrinogen oxidase
MEKGPWAEGAFEARGRRVAVVGAGISGLSAAYRLGELAPHLEVRILEALERPGGVLQTLSEAGFLVEASADSFITTFPWGLDLCRRLGFEDQLLPTDPHHRRAFVVHNGRLKPIPDGLLIMAPSRLRPLLTTPILSLRGKLRMACEWLIPKGGGDDESLASFARRRFGREAYDRLIQPLVGGMYTGDPERLSVRATMPRFLEMEQTHGSLIRAVRRAAKTSSGQTPSGSGARYGLFVAPQAGMASLVEAIVRRLPGGPPRYDAPVTSLRRAPEGSWLLEIGGRHPETLSADGVILATPLGTTAHLVKPLDQELGSLLSGIRTSTTAVVSLGYRRQEVDHPLDGFGFVVPLRERRKIQSGSFASVKFPGRCPDGMVLIRVFLGGPLATDIPHLDDAELVAIAERELAPLLGLRAEAQIRQVHRWSGVMPQYEVGHGERVEAIEARVQRMPHLALAGNAYHGVGVPQCVHSGERAAEGLLASLGHAHEAAEPSIS